MNMVHPFEYLISRAKDKANPEYWIYCHPFFLENMRETEFLLEVSKLENIFWFLYEGSKIGVRPLDDIDMNDLFIANMDDVAAEKLATGKLRIPRELALGTYFYYCEDCMN